MMNPNVLPLEMQGQDSIFYVDGFVFFERLAECGLQSHEAKDQELGFASLGAVAEAEAEADCKRELVFPGGT